MSCQQHRGLSTVLWDGAQSDTSIPPLPTDNLKTNHLRNKNASSVRCLLPCGTPAYDTYPHPSARRECVA